MHGTANCRAKLRLIGSYAEARQTVIEAGYWREIDWMSRISLDSISESDLMREAAWVILSSGMRESVVRRKFPGISAAFLNWSRASKIVRLGSACVQAAAKEFAHLPKLSAILDFIRYLNRHGIRRFKARLKTDGSAFLEQFAYLGPATSKHLAKNLGVNVAKPDRHLVRIASAAGFSDPETLCESISSVVGEGVAVVDVVLWRYATIRRNYLDQFRAVNSVGRAA